ncbi:MAG: F0F1 ATP synthase subunit A [Actinomycetota bacterium]|nr:F0F1 ATP synthase subunit A [Actinomycetota bacterium]
MTASVLATEPTQLFEVPALEHMFEYPALFFENVTVLGIPLGFNRVALLTFVAVAILTALWVGAFRDPKVVPGKFQAVMESIVGFIRDYVVIEVIGPAGLRFVPFLTTLFAFIFLGNLFEVTPLINFPITSRMALPAFLALVTWTIFVLVGIKEQGGRQYMRSVALPPGVPSWVMPLVIPIEVLSTFVVRPLTLSIRLFANMLAGHIILTIIFIGANAFFFDIHSLTFNMKGSIIGVLLGFMAGPTMIGFEIAISALQAYIFTILTAVYISSSMNPEH